MDEGKRALLTELVERYTNARAVLRKEANEAQVRTDFIDPLLEILGWDLRNAKGKPQGLRDVRVEEPVADESSKRRPDYTLRVAGERHLFVEAKRPGIDLTNDNAPAIQVRLVAAD